MAEINAYPLTWPVGWKRTPIEERKYGHFNKKERVRVVAGDQAWYNTNSKNLSVSDGVGRIVESLQKMGVGRYDIIISTNVLVRLDGQPRSGQKEPDDPGAAVYWQEGQGKPMRCMPIDQYTTVADNLAAIAATLEAMRAIERHGGAEILDRAFTGFKALAAENVGPSWWSVLGIEADATREQIEAAYRQEAKSCHPDASTGSHDAMAALNLAREQALAAVRA